MSYIIDGRVRLRTRLLMQPWQKDTRHPAFSQYVGLYGMQDRIKVQPVDYTLREAARAGIDKVVVCGGSVQENHHLSCLSEDKRILVVAGVNLDLGIEVALNEINRVKFSARAINFTPFMAKMDVNDKRCFPIYAECERLGLAAIVHSSLHYWTGTSMWHGSPDKFDDIAVNFPKLKLVMSHGGNGFGPLVLAVAQRHPNVFLEFSALNPKYMDPLFISAANSYLRRKCIFGSDYPLISFDKAVKMWQPVIHEDNKLLFFRDNILSVLTKGVPA